MKRMKQKLRFMVLLSTVVFSACDREEEVVTVSSVPTNDNLIRISVEDGVTRAGYTTSNLTDFGFFVNTPESPEHTYNNVRMVKGETEEWKTEDGLMMRWWNKSAPVDILAYAPYQPNQAYTTISRVPVDVKQDQSTEENLMASDFIAMKWEGFLPWRDEEAGSIPVKLKHLMCRIKLTVIYNSAFVVEEGVSPIKEVRVGGDIYLNGICDFSQSSPVISVKNTVLADIKPLQTGDYPEQYMATYECLAVPQTGNLNAYITFVDGFTFISVCTADLKGGYNYEFVVRAIKVQV